MGIILKNSVDWTYIINTDAIENRDKIISQVHRLNHGSLGKYMFFSDNKEKLISLGKEILLKYYLYNAKVPQTNIPKNSKGFGFVLCIYDEKNTYTSELCKYSSADINYRFWKSDYDTINGVYSNNFKGV